MGIISRLLLFLYVLAVMAALSACGAVCLQMVPTKLWQNILNDLVAREETIMVIGAMMIASLCLLAVVFSGKKNKDEIEAGDDIMLRKGEAGEVLISVDAIASVVERAAMTVNGVREVNSDIYKTSGPVPIKLRLAIVLNQGYSAPQISEKVDVAVNQALKVAFEISDVPIKLKVREITNAVADREKRVV